MLLEDAENEIRKMKARNLVAKHARKFNTARVFDNRKARAKRGYSKHRNRPDEA
jgi:hypothetical protein